MANHKIFETKKIALKLFLMLLIFHVSLFTFDLNAQSITWFRSYESLGTDVGKVIVQTPDNGYILSGRSVFFGLRALRLNTFGDTIWNRIFPGNDATDLIKTQDNNYIVLGLYAVTKIDINGNIIWTHGLYKEETGMVSIKQDSEGNYIICGGMDTLGLYRKPYLLKINSQGNLIWQKTYSQNFFDGLLSDVNISNDNNYIMTGHYTDQPGNLTDELFIMKTDTQGSQIFFYGYDTIRYRYANFIHQQLNGSYIVSGASHPFLISINKGGNIQWFKKYNLLTPNVSEGTTTTFDGGYAITGGWDTVGNANEWCVLLIKTDYNGIEQFRKAYLFAPNDEDFGRDVKQTSDSGFVIVGARGNQFVIDFIALKTDKYGQISTIGIQPISIEIPAHFNLYQNYPNPFNPSTRIKFDVALNSKINIVLYDVLGREVKKIFDDFLKPGIYEINFNASNLSSGVYYYCLTAEGFKETKKMILLK